MSVSNMAPSSDYRRRYKLQAASSVQRDLGALVKDELASTAVTPRSSRRRCVVLGVGRGGEDRDLASAAAAGDGPCVASLAFDLPAFGLGFSECLPDLFLRVPVS